jgi:hypothetical protein
LRGGVSRRRSGEKSSEKSSFRWIFWLLTLHYFLSAKLLLLVLTTPMYCKWCNQNIKKRFWNEASTT